MTTTSPSELAQALGMAALGRRVFLIRKGTERYDQFFDDIRKELGEVVWMKGFTISQARREIVHMPTGGVVRVAHDFDWYPRVVGCDFHHAFGLDLIAAEDRSMVLSRVRLPW